MAQVGDRARWDLAPWAGTLDQLVRAARRCLERIEEAVPVPDEHEPEPEAPDWSDQESVAAYHPKIERWREREGSHRQAQYRAERAREVAIDIVEQDGYQRTLTSIDDLAEFPAEDLDRIRLLDIEIGGTGLSPTSARITVSRGNGLESRAAGMTRLWTSGLRHEVEAILTPRYRLRPPLMANGDVVLGVGVGAAFALWTGLAFVFRDVGDWSPGASLGVAAAIGLLVGCFICSIGMLPEMEILPANQQPKYLRWRGAFRSVAVALVIGVIASVIVALTLPASEPASGHKASSHTATTH